MLGRRAVRFAPRPEPAACSKRSRLSLAEYLGRDCRHDSTCKYVPLHISTLARSVSEIDVGLKRRIAQRFQKLATQRADLGIFVINAHSSRLLSKDTAYPAIA